MILVQKWSVESTQIAFEGLDSSRIKFVSYKENAIKNTERSVRGEVPGVEVVNITAPQLMKQ